MNTAPKPAPRLTAGLLVTAGIFVLAAGLGYYLGGTEALMLPPIKPGGPEVRVKVATGAAREFALSVNGPYALATGPLRKDLRAVPMNHGRGRGPIRVVAAPDGLHIFRPGGPAGGERIPDQLRIEGSGVQTAGRRAPVWGALEIRRVGPDRLEVINVLDIETYLQGVLIPEMGARFPLQALKAQAVAARTYAFAKIRRALVHGGSRLLEPTEVDQVFRPVRSVPAVIRRAVDETRGEVLGTRSRPITAYYHSTCGGSTRNASPSFDQASPLRGRKCTFCRSSKYFAWERRYNTTALARVLTDGGFRITPPVRAVRLRKDATGHTMAVEISHGQGLTRVEADRFRALINRRLAARRTAQLLSTFLESIRLTAGGRQLVVKGHGWGHGVGMCQMGASRLARKGLSYRQILAYYYSQIPLNRAWGEAN